SGSATSSALKANAATSPRRGYRIRGLLVATQVAVSAVLVIAGSLLIHSAIRAVAMSTGYDDAHTLDVSLEFPMTAAYTPDHEAALVRDLRNRLATIPGVADVTVARAPDDEMSREGLVSVNGEEPSLHNMKADLYYTWVEPNYFETLGIPLLLGRAPTRSDEQEHAVVLSESAARALWPGGNPLGRKLRMGTDARYHSVTEPLPDGPEWQVIGVVRDTRGGMLDGSDSAQVYLPLPAKYVQDYPLLMRTRSDPTQLIAAVAAAVAAVDPNVSATAQTLEQMLVQTPPFLAPALAASFASITGLLGLVLAAIGIYGTVSYIVVLRTREVGIRMAMGAKKRDILKLILGESTRPVVAGLSVGVLLACGVAWLLRHVLYGIHTIDAISFAGVSALFLVIAVLAAVIPSRRAMRVDPVVALRYE
ncbi:MAG TPA: FtsX-like permease family protein, partial [Acidobacteriaceae bacterium]|nr:FtsX-like permease family protein [Acidobacteriaceae bacterium]